MSERSLRPETLKRKLIGLSLASCLGLAACSGSQATPEVHKEEKTDNGGFNVEQRFYTDGHVYERVEDAGYGIANITMYCEGQQGDLITISDGKVARTPSYAACADGKLTQDEFPVMQPTTSIPR